MTRSWRTRVATFLYERGGLIALLALVTYVWLAPTTIVDGDNAEFARCGAIGSRAHPTGYPAYVLYLRLTSWLPGVSPAHTANVATALIAALVVLTLHAACRAWGARPGAASVACAIYAASPVVLRIHVEAEVFAPNALVAAAILWLAAAAGPLRGTWRGAALGVVAGLGIANHVTCVLVAPVGILGVVRATREQRVAFAAAVVGLVVGLLPYVYLLYADGPASFGKVDDFGDIIAFVKRDAYGGPGAFAPKGKSALPGANLLALVEIVGRAWLWVPGALGVAMLGVRIARPAGETRAGWIALAASFVLAGPLLVLLFNLEPVGIQIYVLSRFHLLPMILLAIPVAIGLDEIVRRSSKLPSGRGRATIAAAAVFVVLVIAAWPRLAAQHSPAVEREVVNTLRWLPPNAVAVVNGDDLCLGMEYAKYVLGERPDVDVVCWGAVPWDWYQDEMIGRGITIRDGETYTADIDRILASRPLLFTPSLKYSHDRSYRFGLLVRMLPRGQKPPPPRVVFEYNRALFSWFDLHYPRPRPEDDWAAVVHKRYATTWSALAFQLAAAGEVDAAKLAMAYADELAPRD